jgi:hypothetical protein
MAPERAFTKFRENDLQYCYRLLLRSAGLLKLDLHERIALTLLELCSDFGVAESRGTLLRQPFSHGDIAELVGATGQESPNIWLNWSAMDSSFARDASLSFGRRNFRTG